MERGPSACKRRLEVATLGGEVLEMVAEKDWSVWDLKLALARKAFGGEGACRTGLRKLFTEEGVELEDTKPLGDYCSPTVEETTHLSLVTLQKTEAEVRHLEWWLENTPEWQQRRGERLMEPRDFVPTASTGRSKRAAAKSTLRATEKEEDEPASCLTSGREVLARIRQGRKPRALERGRFQTPCTLWWSAAHACPILVTGGGSRLMTTLDAVVEAVGEAPSQVLSLVEDADLAERVLERCPGTFEHLPRELRESKEMIAGALRIDEALQEEYVATASKAEVQRWRWEVSEREDHGRCRGRRKVRK